MAACVRSDSAAAARVQAEVRKGRAKAEAAEKRHNSWYGTWVIRAVAPNDGADKMLVTSRSVLKLRDFRTIVGLVSFLADMGCKTASIPLEEGGRERHAAPGRIDAARGGASN